MPEGNMQNCKCGHINAGTLYYITTCAGNSVIAKEHYMFCQNVKLTVFSFYRATSMHSTDMLSQDVRLSVCLSV